MTYTSGKPGVPMTPEAKLASKQWRRTNSWWILPPVLSCGFLGWLGFLVAAIRTGKKHYWVACGVYAALFAAFMTMVSVSDLDSLVSDLAMIPFLGCWLAPTIHAAIVNRDYLKTLAAKGDWYQTAVTAPRQQESSPPTTLFGVSGGDYYAPTEPATPPAPPAHPRSPAQSHPAGHSQQGEPLDDTSTAQIPTPQNASVDINAATAERLAGLPGIDRSLAERVITIRDARGGYRDLDDLAAAANLQPHQLVSLRDHLTFDQPSQRPNQQHGRSGRILDI